MPVFMNYRDIADDMEARIRRGEYPRGGKLPTYAEVAAMYSVSHSTVARVFLAMRERGLTDSAPGKGVFVAEELTPRRV